MAKIYPKKPSSLGNYTVKIKINKIIYVFLVLSGVQSHSLQVSTQTGNIEIRNVHDTAKYQCYTCTGKQVACAFFKTLKIKC